MSVPRSATNFWKMTKGKVVEGVFAVNKPTGITSAQVLRDLQHHFNPSELFAPWLQMERNARAQESNNQRKRRREKNIQVKIGHGGTLDPLATGVLITGVGRGTKNLQDFLLCTKEYDAIVLFGTSTDTYDRVGKVLRREPTDHITREMVEGALGQFRGKFQQLPPLYSALKMNGKPLYEYAREGKEIPREIERRPVEVLKLELVEWMEGGTHLHEAPTDEAGHSEINLVNKLWKQEGVLPAKGKRGRDEASARSPKTIRGERAISEDGPQASSVLQDAKGIKSSEDEEISDLTPLKPEIEASMADATENETQPSRKRSVSAEEEQELQSFEHQKRKMSEDQDDLIFDRPPTKSRRYQPTSSQDTAMMSGGLSDSPSDSPSDKELRPTSVSNRPAPTSTPKKGPPAARLRMTVTSGFYVRSLCHDLGTAVGSVALMAELKRTRQGDFEVGKNTLEYNDLEQGERVWGPKVEGWLDEWEEKHPTGMRPRGGVARKESKVGEFKDEKSGDGSEERKDQKKSFQAFDRAFDEEKERGRGFVGRDF